MPVLNPRELWEESGRWDEFGDVLFRLKDRKDRDLCLGPTHEEVISDLARAYISSYRELPQTWYQIQTKFRDEARPRAGVIRGRQFIMMDAYSMDFSEEGLDKSYDDQRQIYERIYRSGEGDQSWQASHKGVFRQSTRQGYGDTGCRFQGSHRNGLGDGDLPHEEDP